MCKFYGLSLQKGICYRIANLISRVQVPLNSLYIKIKIKKKKFFYFIFFFLSIKISGIREKILEISIPFFFLILIFKGR